MSTTTLATISRPVQTVEVGELVTANTGRCDAFYHVGADGLVVVSWHPHHPLYPSRPRAVLPYSHFAWLLHFWSNEPLRARPVWE